MGAGRGGGGGGGGARGAQGAPRNGTSTCRSLINIINHMVDYLCHYESSKIMLSEVRQLLHITLPIPATSATAE